MDILPFRSYDDNHDDDDDDDDIEKVFVRSTLLPISRQRENQASLKVMIADR